MDSVVALATSDGSIRWTVSRGGSLGTCQFAPAIGSDGTIYAPGPGTLTAITPNGQVLWRQTGIASTPGSPVVGDAGIYVVTASGVWAYSASGVRRTGFETRPFRGAAITLGANDVLYLLAVDTLISYDESGARRFATPIPNPGPADEHDCNSISGPTIGPDGTVYVRGYRGVYALRDTVGPSPDAPWVTLQGNFYRTGYRATGR